MLYGERQLRTGLYSHATRIIYSKQLDLGQSFPWSFLLLLSFSWLTVIASSVSSTSAVDCPMLGNVEP